MEKALPLAMPLSKEELFTHICVKDYFVMLCTRHEVMVGSYYPLQNGELNLPKFVLVYNCYASTMKTHNLWLPRQG